MPNVNAPSAAHARVVEMTERDRANQRAADLVWIREQATHYEKLATEDETAYRIRAKGSAGIDAFRSNHRVIADRYARLMSYLTHARAGAAERGAREVTDEMVTAAIDAADARDVTVGPDTARFMIREALAAAPDDNPRAEWVRWQNEAMRLRSTLAHPSSAQVERAARELASDGGWHWENAACPHDQFTKLATRALTAALGEQT